MGVGMFSIGIDHCRLSVLQFSVSWKSEQAKIVYIMFDNKKVQNLTLFVVYIFLQIYYWNRLGVN